MGQYKDPYKPPCVETNPFSSFPWCPGLFSLPEAAGSTWPSLNATVLTVPWLQHQWLKSMDPMVTLDKVNLRDSEVSIEKTTAVCVCFCLMKFWISQQNLYNTSWYLDVPSNHCNHPHFKLFIDSSFWLFKRPLLSGIFFLEV